MVGPGASKPVERRSEHISTVRFAEVETRIEGTVESNTSLSVMDICSLEKDERKGSLCTAI